MVRETRHLWVGNLPENISEDRIREHFKRYGPVHSVKVVSQSSSSGNCDDGVCATVSFVDICSAAKAHKADHRMEERLLKTNYYEPSLTALSATHYPSAGSSLHRESPHYSSSSSQQSNSHLPHGARSPIFSTGLNEDLNSYERSSHFYESRRDETIGYNGPGGSNLSGVPVGSGVQGGMRRGGYPGDRDPDFNTGSRGRVRSYPPRGHFLTNGRSEPGEYRWSGTGQYRYHADSYADDKLRRGTQAVSPPPPIPRTATRNPRLSLPSNKRRLPTSRSGSESPSSSRSSRSSSSSSSTSSSRSTSSRSGSLGRSSRSNSRSPRRIGNVNQSVTTIPILSPPGEKRPMAICVKNLPPWSSDSSLKDGLFHDYKKHGKVVAVQIFGSGSDRFAVVCFKKPEDAEKAYDASQDKQFFGVKIQVSPHEGLELDDNNEFRNYDADLDEYHPKATRTLFIGGLDKDVTAAELRKQFECFGEIIEIDIKKQNSSTFAFCQFSDIRSVVQAVKKMDGEFFAGNRIKLGFGKSMSNRCIWVGGISDGITESVLWENFSRFGPITHRNIDREKGHALIAYDSERHASAGVSEMRGCILGGKRLQVDFASRECQVAFYENLNKQEFPTTERTWERRTDVDKFERSRREGSYIARQIPAQRIQNYTSTRSRNRYEGFEEYNAGRNFEEFADNSFERDLHEYAGRQRFENGPSTSTLTTTTNTTTTTTTTAAATATTTTTVKHRSFSPVRSKRDDKSPISPRSIARDSENASPLVRIHDDLENRKSVRHRSTSDHDSFHSQSPPPRGRNSVSRVPSQSPSTPIATSPSREVTVIEDPRRRRPSDFKDLVVRVSDMRRPSNSPVRHRNSSSSGNHRGVQSDVDIDEVDSFTGKNELHDPRLNLRREDLFSSGDERSLDEERPPKKQKYAESMCGTYEKTVKRNSDSFEFRQRDQSPGFRKPFDSSRKSIEGKFAKRENNRVCTDELLRSPQPDPRHRKSSVSDIDESSPWRGRDISLSSAGDGDFLSDTSPPGTPVRDEREDPPVTDSCNRRTIPFSIQREKTFSPLSLPLPKFAQQIRLHLSPRGTCSSPRGGSLLRSPTFNTGTSWNLTPVEVNSNVEESDPILADTPVSPGPALHDSPSDSEESPTVSPTNMAGDLYERIKALDEKYEKWTGSARSFGKSPLSGRSTGTSESVSRSSFTSLRKKRILDLEELKSQEPSDIMKSLLSKRSVFDEDSERLENISDKYEPRPFSSMSRSKIYSANTTTFSVSNSSSGLISTSTCTTLPVPSATPLNSLPGIRRSSTTTSASISSPQATKSSYTPTSTVVCMQNSLSLSRSNTVTKISTAATHSTTPTSSSTTISFSNTTTTTTTTSSSVCSSTSVMPSTSNSPNTSASLHSRSSTGSSVSTPGPPVSSENIVENVSPSPSDKLCDSIVTVIPDTRVTGAVSVIQTTCNSKSLITTTTQAITSSSSSVQQFSPLDSSLKLRNSEEICKSPNEGVTILKSLPEKKVLIEKEQVQNTSLDLVDKGTTFLETNKVRVKDHYNHCSIKSESVIARIKNEPEELIENFKALEQTSSSSSSSIHKRRLSLTDIDATDRKGKHNKEFFKVDTKSFEPENKKIKLEQEEEKENKSIKSYREKDTIRIERKERMKSGKREESKDILEDKGVQSVIEIASAAASVLSCDKSEVKTDGKIKREEKLDVKEKPQIYKSPELKEEKIKDVRENRKDKLEEKGQYLHKHNHNEKYKTQDKSSERKTERQDEKKEIKSEYKEEKEDKEEKKREHKEDYKVDRKEERDEKLKDYERRRHSEESKSREDRKDKNRDRKDRDKLRDRERHRSNFGSHSEKDVEREKRREKEKQRQLELGKEKEKQKHIKSSKVEERLRHHSGKKERRDTLSSISSPSDHSSLSCYSEKSSKVYSHKPTKRNSQSSLEQHEDEAEGGITTMSEHKPYLGHNDNRSKESVTERSEDLEFQEKVDRKKHDSGKSEDKLKSHISPRNSHYPKIKCSLNEDDDRLERVDSEISSDEDKTKSHLQPAKRTKQRATSSSSGSRRGRPKNKSILDTESESVDTESDSENKPKKASYFEITIYDGNMYDKVKARRVKSNQKPDDDIKQQKLKQKLLQQRTKRSKKTPTRSCISIQSESEDSDTEIPKKRGHARIHSSSEEESYIRSRTHLSSEESDSPSLGNHDKSNNKLSKDLKLKKVVHVSDITTDEETAPKSVSHLSGTESDIEPRLSEKSLKIESEEELSETGNRKPPRPALSASRNHSKERDKVSMVDKTTHLYKESKVAEEETDVTSVCEDIRLIKPKLRESFETISSKSDKRKYSDSNLKEKDRKEGRMKAIFGLMSDDSDSNAPPSNLSITSPDLVSATSYRKDSASSGTSSDPLHMTPPNPVDPTTGIYESDIDDDFRPVTPDLPSQKRSEIEFEPSVVIDKTNLNKCEFESSECMKDILEINEVAKETLSQSWKEDSEQAVKETVCETSRAASDSGKGSSSGVSSASSSSGSSAEELLLMETGTGPNFREEVEINNEINNSKNYIFERERDSKESIPRKDKKKKKKHKDKESSRSHRHSSNKTRESHNHPVDKTTIEETSTHHFKLGSVKESAPLPSNDRTLINNLSSNSPINENISLEKTRESNVPFANITVANKSPPLDMPIIKPDEIEAEPEPLETEIEEKTHKISVDSENAVQSISATDDVSKRTQPVYEITESLSSPPQTCPVEEIAPKASRSTISQEETLNAVAGLLACYNYYQEETSPNQTDDEPIMHSESTTAIDDPIEQSEEAQKAAQMLQSEIGVEREPEDRDDSWEEPLPLNETDENIDESPAILTSLEHSDNNSSLTDPKKSEELQISHEHEHSETSAKEPLQFPDSPSSVQSEPALQIDEDEQIETLDTNLTDEKVNVVREVVALPQERSSVWNTPESDIQDGKPLGLTEESLQNKNADINICEVEKSPKPAPVQFSEEKYNPTNETDVSQENEEASDLPSDEATKVDDESNSYSKTACDAMLKTADNCSTSVSPDSLIDKDIKTDIKVPDLPVPEIKSECSSNLDVVKEEPNSSVKEDVQSDSNQNMIEEPNKIVETVVKEPEELVAATSVASGDEKFVEISNEENDRKLEEVLISERKLEEVLISETDSKNEDIISDSQDFHTPSKSSEDLNTSIESSATEMSTPEKDFKLNEPEIRIFAPRGRARGRGRRGCRRVVDTASSTVMSTILTRSSSANAKNSKPRGRGRSIRNSEVGEEEMSGENITPEQPRRSTRMKRARKHPDMVEHDETTNRRKRGARNGKTCGEDTGMRTSLSSSDVYDFHDSDEGEIEVALSKKGQKRETNKPLTPRSPSKLSEEVPDIHDSAGNTRKSRRLREKNVDDDPNLQTAVEGELESEAPPVPLTRSRGRVKKDTDEDDICNTPRKSPRSRIKINDNDQEPSRDIPTGNESSISEVVIQKIESPVNSIIPPVSIPAKAIIIPCSTTKVYTTSIPTITSQITTMSINTIPSVYSSTVSSHPVKLSIVPAGVRNVSKVTPATCMIPSNSYPVTSTQSSAVTVTSVPASSQIQMENFVTQTIPFAVTSSKEMVPNPIKAVVPINCNSLPPSAFKTFPNGKKPDTIPTPLVDPVTGHLTPMKMSDEGHYIPIADHLSLANKDKLKQPLHQTKVLRVLPPSITVTTITNSNPSVTVSIPSCTVSTLVSPNRAIGLSSLAKGAAVTSLSSRGNEISVELVSRTRPSVPPPSTASILLAAPKGIPNFNTKSPISLTPSHVSTPPVTNSVVISSHATVSQTNTPNIVTIATSNKIFSTSSSAILTTTSSVATRGTVLSSSLAPIKGSIPAKIQPVPVPKATGSSQTGINVQNIILSSNNSHHPALRNDYPPPTQVINTVGSQQQQQVPPPPPQQQQTPSTPAGPIGTVSLSRIPPSRSNTVVHEPHIQEYVSMGVNPRYSDPNNSRFRESSIVEVARIQGGTPSALSPVPRNPEVEATHIPTRTHYDMHAATSNAHSRQGIRGSSSGPIPHVPAPVGSKAGLTHFYGDIHKKGGTPQPLPVVPPGVPVERFLASPPLHTPPSTQTPPPPPPAHHHNTQRENLQINLYRNPYIVPADPRAIYGGEKISLSPMPMDLKVIEKNNHISDKGAQEDKDRPGTGPISISEFSSSRPGTVITPHNSTSPHHLPSPHYDRSTDSPQVTMMYNRRYYDGNIYPPNRSGTPGMEPEVLPRSPLSFATAAAAAALPPGESHHSPRLQIAAPQFPSQVSPQMPPQTDSFQYILQSYPVMWDGILGLKNEQVMVKMHFISGSVEVARGALPEGATTSLIRISQRMRLEQSQLEGVARKMQMKAEHCILMALPYGNSHYDLMKQKQALETGFIKYLGEDKKAAGIVNVHLPGSQQSAYVIHIFPPCDFANDNLRRIAPELHGVAQASRLLVIIATC